MGLFQGKQVRTSKAFPFDCFQDSRNFEKRSYGSLRISSPKSAMIFQKMINKRKVDQAKMWWRSLGVYGAAAGALGLFFTASWVGGRFLKHVPFYNVKYEEKPRDM